MDVERVVVVQQTVGQYFHLYLLHHRRQSPQGLDQSGIAVYLVVQAADDMVIRPAVLAEVLIVGSHLLQGVGQVERHLLFLRVEQDRELVRLRDDVNHPLVLTVIIFVETLLCFGTLLESRLQLRAKVLQRSCQRPSTHDGPERKGTYHECQNEYQRLLFHIVIGNPPQRYEILLKYRLKFLSFNIGLLLSFQRIPLFLIVGFLLAHLLEGLLAVLARFR